LEAKGLRARGNASGGTQLRPWKVTGCLRGLQARMETSVGLRPSRTIYKDEVIRRRVQLPAACLLPTWRTVAPIRHTGPDLDLIHDPGPSAKPSRAASPP
jgi:hypothetical protein